MGQILGSVKLHSWVTVLGQQRTEAERGRSVNFGDSYPLIHPEPLPKRWESPVGPVYLPSMRQPSPR